MSYDVCLFLQMWVMGSRYDCRWCDDALNPFCPELDDKWMTSVFQVWQYRGTHHAGWSTVFRLLMTMSHHSGLYQPMLLWFIGHYHNPWSAFPFNQDVYRIPREKHRCCLWQLMSWKLENRHIIPVCVKHQNEKWWTVRLTISWYQPQKRHKETSLPESLLSSTSKFNSFW